MICFLTTRSGGLVNRTIILDLKARISILNCNNGL